MSFLPSMLASFGFRFAAAVLLSAVATGAFAAEKVTVAEAGAVLLRLPLYVALQNGDFAAEGLDVQVVETRAGSDATKMLAGGSVDLAIGQLIDTLNLYKQEIRVQGVALLMQRLTNSIVVRKAVAGEIKSMRDLKGRTFGVTGVGSGSWQFAAFVGIRDGVKPEEFNFIGVGTGATVIGAIKAGRIDALSYGDPENPKLVKDGDAVFLVDMADEATHQRIIGNDYLNNQVIVLAQFAKDHPKTVQSFVNAIQRTLNWVHAHSEAEVAKVIAAYPAFSGMSQDDLLASMQRLLVHGVPTTTVISREAYDNGMKLPQAVGAVTTPMPYEQLVDTSFAEAAAKLHPPPQK